MNASLRKGDAVESEMTENTESPEVQEETLSEKTEEVSAPQKVSLPAFFGVKSGMTRLFNDDGKHIPVTVIKLIPNYIAQVKTKGKDGYEAYQVGYYEKREKLINKPIKGHLAKGNLPSMSRFSEIPAEKVEETGLGKEVGLELFTPASYIDVTGTSKGKGFQGVIKRYGFSGGPASHGSHFHRTTGSIGNRATPGRVFAQKKMPGHMGSLKTTVQNLQVVEVNEQEGYMLVKGSVPGCRNSIVKIAKAKKA